GRFDLRLVDLTTDTELLVLDETTVGADGSINDGALSADGRFIAFGLRDTLYRYEIATETIVQVTPDSDDSSGIFAMAISGDGNLIAAATRRADLTGGSLETQVLLFDVAAGTTRLVSATPEGTPAADGVD